MKLVRMPIEAESPEQFGYDRIKHNLTESSVRDRTLKDIGVDFDNALLCYDNHLGREDLRELIASQGEGLSAEDVLVTPGAVAALFFIAMACVGPGDHMVVMRPNYATNIETPRAFQCDISYLDLDFDDAYAFDFDALKALVRPETKLVSLTFPHNPTGASIGEEALRAVVAFAEERGLRLLIDETYREMAQGAMLPVAASLSPTVVSVSSLSKTYGAPGVRIGWATCRDKAFMYRLLCAKEQVTICGSVLDEAAGVAILRGRDDWLPRNDATIAGGLARVARWIEGDPRFEWVPPKGGCVCFPRIRPDLDVNMDRFYRTLNEEFGTYVGPGHWFEQPRRHFRIGYAWPTPEELDGGLEALSAALDRCL